MDKVSGAVPRFRWGYLRVPGEFGEGQRWLHDRELEITVETWQGFWADSGKVANSGGRCWACHRVRIQRGIEDLRIGGTV